MTKLTVNQKDSYEILTDENAHYITIKGKSHSLDCKLLKKNNFHILLNNQSFNAEILSVDEGNKTILIKVNNNEYSVVASDPLDVLLNNLGMQHSGQKKINEIKAPMPGLILDVKVVAGQEIKKGESLIVLEAMKMENSIKAPADGVVKEVKAIKGNKVEKNEVLFILS
jgi:biotin carboxyl carrier protein